jgi:hypothetical protein
MQVRGSTHDDDHDVQRSPLLVVAVLLGEPDGENRKAHSKAGHQHPHDVKQDIGRLFGPREKAYRQSCVSLQTPHPVPSSLNSGFNKSCFQALVPYAANCIHECVRNCTHLAHEKTCLYASCTRVCTTQENTDVHACARAHTHTHTHTRALSNAAVFKCPQLLTKSLN